MSHGRAYGFTADGVWTPLQVGAMGAIAASFADLPAGDPAIVNPWSYAAASGGITDTSDVTLVAAPGAGRSNYLTSMTVCNTSATATEVVVKSGSTILWRCKVGASMTRPAHIDFQRPLISTNNTALTAACITTGTATYIDAQGYTDETIEQITADLTRGEELFDQAGAAIYDEAGIVITIDGGDSSLTTTPPTFDPASLFVSGESGAVYDFSNLSTLYEERTAGGTTPSSVDGVIGTARDLSGLGNHWVAVSDAGRPLLRLSGGVYYADADGVDDRMTATIAMALPVTRLSCIRQSTWVSGDRIFHGGVGNSYLGQNNVTPQLAHFNGTWGSLNGNASVGAFAVVCEQFGTSGTSGASLQVNNTTATTHTGTYTNHTTISMSDGASPGEIDYAAVIVINRALTTTELANCKTWLGARGGITL